MGDSPSRIARKGEFVAIIDQDAVTDEVRDIALKYDPLKRSGRQGFHVTADGDLHIDNEEVIEEHRIVANKIPNDAIEIVRLPAERGALIHQYGENGFRLYELPALVDDRVIGLLGPNGIGKSTALDILAGRLKPNLGSVETEPGWDEIVRQFRGTATQTHLERLRAGSIRSAVKPQRVDRLTDLTGTSIRELIEHRDDRSIGEEVIERFDLDRIGDQRIDELSGGELQRVAVAITLVADADAYLFDEPSSFLDVGQRVIVARAIADLTSGKAVLVIDHDLVTLDILADDVHVAYGHPRGFGIVSRKLSARRGINEFLAGRLHDENVRIRDTALEFHGRSIESTAGGPSVLEFPTLRKRFDTFSLEIESGSIRAAEILGILGANGLGKTTFARLLAGTLDPDVGRISDAITIAYKPQYLEPDFTGTVEELFAAAVDIYDRAFEREINEPFTLEPLFEAEVTDLSGGELQRVGIALALARDADVYLLDEPSAFLDVQQRATFATTLRGFVERTDAPCLVIDHDLLLLDYLADRVMRFDGRPGITGVGRTPQPVPEGIDRFLRGIGVTFRREPETGRPRANKPGSMKDREQKRAGIYFER